ncbi:facilitated trehalose transporter Tret1-like isoform X2 [Diorhabda sublineata]|nr:facilitated trehalose transporter Tret1-like isoform X2 [Diorhabda sublineata]XP_056637544.1 facilitated trehalose transporter Tret1-like isoform X2 [Diorhabda sublineata]
MECNPVQIQVEFSKINLVTQKVWYKVSWFTYLYSLAAGLLVTSFGLSIGWSSPVLSKLHSNDTNINPLGAQITTIETSLVVSLPLIGTAASYLVWAKIADTLGRAIALRLVATILVFSLTITAFTTNIYLLCITLTITGASASGALLCVSIYNSEIAEENDRGKLGCLMAMQVPIGLLGAFIFGSFCSVRVFTLICAIPPILHLIFTCFLPESPVYLVSKNRIPEAIISLQNLRRTKTDEDIEEDVKKIKDVIRNTATARKRNIFDIFRNRATKRGFFLSLEVFLVEQLSGISIILAYISVIFNEAGTGLSGDTVGIIVGLVKMVTFLVATNFIDKYGRRLLLLISSICCMFPMLFLGIYFYLKSINSSLVENIHWVAVLCVILYVIMYAIGLGNVPMAFVGEIFPDDLRAQGIACTLIFDELLVSLITFSFPLLSESIGTHWCFFICSISSFLGFICLYLTIPETKGKTFSEIQKILQGCN